MFPMLVLNSWTQAVFWLQSSQVLGKQVWPTTPGFSSILFLMKKIHSLIAQMVYCGLPQDLAFSWYTVGTHTLIYCLTTGLHSEQFCGGVNIIECTQAHIHSIYMYRCHSIQSIQTHPVYIWLLLVGYKPIQHAAVMNTVGHCNTIANICVSKHRKGKEKDGRNSPVQGISMSGACRTGSCSR